MRNRMQSYGRWLGILSLTFVLSIDLGARSVTANDDALFTRQDENEDGVLSGSEVAVFLPFDANQDGEVSKEEFVAGLNRERRLLQGDDGAAFGELDSNEDEVLSGTEVKGNEAYDADGDGEVTVQEFRQGRASRRRILGVPDKNELTRQAQQKFRQLDRNEDGRLSGKEMIGFEKLDANSDKRITEAEFLAEFTGDESVPIGDPVDIFLAMIRTSNPMPFLKACDPDFAREMDAPVLAFIMQRLEAAIGTLDPAAKDALQSRELLINDKPHTVYEGDLAFKDGNATAKLFVERGRIVGFRIDTPLLEGIGDQLYTALTTDQKFSRSLADFYTPRCEDFIRLILSGEDDKAFAKYHPEVQKQLGRDRVQAVFETFRENCGTFKSLELEILRVEFDSNKKGENCKLVHLIHGSKKDYMATTTFQFIGLAAHIVGLAVKPAEPDQNPPPETEKPAEVQWVNVAARAEGVTFEMPGKPKRTVNEEKRLIVYRTENADKTTIYTTVIENVGENFEPNAETFFKQIQKDLVEALEGELLDTDDYRAGNHPGILIFIKSKDGVLFAERAVIVGSRIYRFQVVTEEQDKAKREGLANRFFESAKFIETDDDAPKPPGQPLPKPPQVLPSPPKPPQIPKPPVP